MSVSKQYAGGKKKNRSEFLHFNFVHAHKVTIKVCDAIKNIKIGAMSTAKWLFCNLSWNSPNSKDCQAPTDQSQCEMTLFGVLNCFCVLFCPYSCVGADAVAAAQPNLRKYLTYNYYYLLQLWNTRRKKKLCVEHVGIADKSGIYTVHGDTSDRRYGVDNAITTAV